MVNREWRRTCLAQYRQQGKPSPQHTPHWKLCVCVCEAGLHDRSGFNRTSAQSLHTPLIVVIFHNLINLVGKKNVRKSDVFKLFKDSSSRRNDKKRQQIFTLKKQKLSSFIDYWFTDDCIRRTCCSLLRMNDSEKDARVKMFAVSLRVRPSCFNHMVLSCCHVSGTVLFSDADAEQSVCTRTFLQTTDGDGVTAA